MAKIQLNEKDFIKKGSYGEVYRYNIKGYEIAVKCYKNQKYAETERNVLEEV